MEHTDKDQSEISRNISLPCSTTIAMGLPEILYHVFSFLDQRTLIPCLQVSRFWYTHGRPLAWQAFSIDIEFFSRLAYDIHVGTIKGKLRGFIENCHYIRSLTLTIPESYRSTEPEFPGTFHPRVAGLKNLKHFAVKSEQTLWESTEYYRLAGEILSQNPGIQEIVWQQPEDTFRNDNFTNRILKRVVGGKLKKLTIDGFFRMSEMRFLEYLIDANKERQEQKQQEGPTITTQGALMGDSVKNETESKNDNRSGTGHGFGLEELILRHSYHSTANWEWLYSYPDDLSIRTLKLVNYEPIDRDLFPGDGDEGDDLGHSILPILSKCPDLEKLSVSFDRHPVLPDNSSRRFLSNLAQGPHYANNPYGYKAENGHKGYVGKMYEYCPKLRDIEFGICYQLTSDHWIEIMKKYGPQLESLSIWGNLTAFNSEAFTALVGPPILNVTRDGFHTLTRLNINGMEHLHDCAWTALHLLPNLREFRARDVPLDAKSLMEKDWICQGLEVLEICVAIPRRTQWRWSDTHGVWTKGHEHCGSDMKARWQDEGKHHKVECEDNRDETEKSLKRPAKSLAPERPRKKAREEAREYIDTQVEVCVALGLLTQLRELRIEGQRQFEFCKHEWGCLELTLETGLEHLAPLRRNLERLIVSGLDEGLCGKKEVEWIARNWVHHSNKRWFGQHHASSKSMGGPKGNRMAGVRSDGDVSFDPRSKFEELIGISEKAEGARSNIKWLQEQCPTLSIVKAK